MIKFDHATKRYPDGTVAVDDLELEAPTGQITVLVGPSGCGKTTSLRMINRMIEPTGGTIWLDDTDTASMPAHELRRQIGYVIQHAGLFPHRTIVDNVATVPFLLGTDKKQARSRAMELLERVGLDPAFAKRYPGQLSGGQQQRVGVARALAADPPVMLMDEPFSRRRPGRPRAAAGRVPAAAGRPGQDDRLRHPRHRRGDQARRPGRGAPCRRQARPAGHARPSCSPRPVDAFVAGFVGRDRGYRALGFAQSGALPVRDERTVTLGDPAPQGGEPVLVVDDDRRPQGWVRGGCRARSASRTCCAAARWPPRAAPCGPPSTPASPRPRGAAWSSTSRAVSWARSPRARCST